MLQLHFYVFHYRRQRLRSAISFHSAHLFPFRQIRFSSLKNCKLICKFIGALLRLARLSPRWRVRWTSWLARAWIDWPWFWYDGNAFDSNRFALCCWWRMCGNSTFRNEKNSFDFTCHWIPIMSIKLETFVNQSKKPPSSGANNNRSTSEKR